MAESYEETQRKKHVREMHRAIRKVEKAAEAFSSAAIDADAFIATYFENDDPNNRARFLSADLRTVGNLAYSMALHLRMRTEKR